MICFLKTFMVLLDVVFQPLELPIILSDSLLHFLALFYLTKVNLSRQLSNLIADQISGDSGGASTELNWTKDI